MQQLFALSYLDVLRNVSGLGFLWALYILYPYRHNHAIPLVRAGIAIVLMAGALYRLSNEGGFEFHTPAFLTLTTLFVTLKIANTNTLPAMLIQVSCIGSTIITLLTSGIDTLFITSLSAMIFWFMLDIALPEEIHN
ncbi:hypothetical protein ACROAH_21355 [Shewanella oncorhynchi]|uniref:hypothetical protein n=1 Tax=Shewanella TaxID=22 RepID=UPI0039B12419